MKQLTDFFANEKVSAILDTGTGTGDFIEVLKIVFPKSKITGIDPDIESLQEASKKYPELLFAKMGAENLNFNDNTFDLASISMALHHLPDIQEAMKEMQRVVKPNGWIIVNELFSDNLTPAEEVHKIMHHFRSKIDRLIGISHNETFKKEEIREIVKAAGIEAIFEFENQMEPISLADSNELENRLEKMKLHLEKIKGRPEYDIFQTQIEEFKKVALKHGFQSAPRLVLVGKPAK
jgi:ubiquinone/menaquinone biosynthesis C-methylase UbiE